MLTASCCPERPPRARTQLKPVCPLLYMRAYTPALLTLCVSALLPPVEMMAETCYLAESTICYPPLFNELRQLTPRPTYTTETVAMAAVAASLEQNAGAILVMSTSGNTARLISKFRPRCPIMTLTRNDVTARQIHLHRGCYPFYFNEPRPHSDEGWQTDVDNRIRYGLKQGLELGILKKGDTIIAVQGWKSGGNHTSEPLTFSFFHCNAVALSFANTDQSGSLLSPDTMRILSVPHDSSDYKLQPTS